MTNKRGKTLTKTYTRRQALSLAGAGTAALALSGCGSDGIGGSEEGSTASADGASPTGVSPDCVLTPEEIEGPFYTDLNLVRRDITDGKPGSPLELRITVVDSETCAPIPDATVDIWHADAIGLYSAFTGQGDSEDVDTTAESFLRGVQATDSSGTASSKTIYPGWYMGRTTHIHLKAHFADKTKVTTQLYFPDEVTDSVYAAHAAYAERGAKDTPNGDDDFSAGSASLRMKVTEASDGYLAEHTIGISRS